VFLVIILSTFLLLAIFLGEKPELAAYDLRTQFRTSPASSEIVIVAIDNKSLNKANKYDQEGLGRFPWPRTAYGKILDFINEGDPRLIVLDINFEGKNICEKKQFSDNEFINSLAQIPNVFFVTTLSTPQKLFRSNYKEYNKLQSLIPKQKKHIYDSIFGHIPTRLIQKHYSSIEITTPFNEKLQDKLVYYELPFYLEGIYRYARGLGVNNSFADIDDTVRSYQPVYKYRDNFLLSIPLKVVVFLKGDKPPVKLSKDFLGIGDLQIPLNKDLRFYLNWHSQAEQTSTEKQYFTIPEYMHYQTISFYQVFFHEDYNLKSDIFKDKIVLIGTTASTLKDVKKVPGSNIMFGVEILATAIDNLINDTAFITKAPLLFNVIVALLLLSAGAGISYYYLKRRQNMKKTGLYGWITSLIALIFGYIFINTFIFVIFSYWLALFYPLLLYILVFSSLVALNAIIDRDKRSQVEGTFAKYVSPQVYKTLLEDYKTVDLSSKRYEVTVLFSDIRGFTPFTENLSPEEVSAYLNKYFNAMVKVILKHNGTIDKFMGDAIMAFFGAPVTEETHALQAAKAALEMKQTLEVLNAEWSKEGKSQLNMGIGLNTGMALVGNFGADNLMDFTVIGDTVNLASRLESLNKEENTNILISAHTFEHIKDYAIVNEIGPRKVKGKSESVIVYELLNIE
jgi:adenylate cyclase